MKEKETGKEKDILSEITLRWATPCLLRLAKAGPIGLCRVPRAARGKLAAWCERKTGPVPGPDCPGGGVAGAGPGAPGGPGAWRGTL